MFQTMKETMINISQAKAHLSAYARQIKKGHRFILCDRNKAFAEIRPLAGARGGQRPFGLAAGRLAVPDDFNAPDPDIEALFEGSR